MDATEERAALLRRGNLGRLGMLASKPLLAVAVAEHRLGPAACSTRPCSSAQTAAKRCCVDSSTERASAWLGWLLLQKITATCMHYNQ